MTITYIPTGNGQNTGQINLVTNDANNPSFTIDLVGEGLWYLLTGILVIVMIKNSVAEMECEKSKSDMVSKYKNNRGTVSEMEKIDEK